ncbi:MAG: putative DNA binding domain-containing protein [Chitinispirillaceae bacterium]|nr:putative DNA binding domain-containing protein [Chitinispirillaceae bacterium]
MPIPERIDLLIREGEGLFIEFKEHFTPRIAEDMVAFANTRGGTILLGVKDDRTVAGEKCTNVLKARILSLARNCSPSIEISVRQAGDVVAVMVPEGREKPYSCSSGYFRRLDAVTQKMTNHELRIIFRETDSVRFEQKVCRECSIKDLSAAKIKDFCKAASISHGNTGQDALLEGLELAGDKGITNAGVMLFGKNPVRFIHQCSMLLLAFKGTTSVDIYDRMDVKDDLIIQFNEAVTFIKKHINRRSIIEGTYRRDVYEVPEPVIREAVANAIVHRDYAMTGTDITISIFDDRLEIKNPGGLLPGVTEKTLGKISVRRNPLISEMFNRIDIIEKAGTGFGRMREALAREGFPEPEIQSESFFFITFRRVYNLELTVHEPAVSKEKIDEGTIKKTSKKTSKKTINKTNKKIIDLLKNNPEMTLQELSEAIELSLIGVRWNIDKLREMGYIRRIGPDKGGHWEVLF